MVANFVVVVAGLLSNERFFCGAIINGLVWIGRNRSLLSPLVVVVVVVAAAAAAAAAATAFRLRPLCFVKQTFHNTFHDATGRIENFQIFY